MIAKCIAILAVVVQINASGCDQSSVVLPTCESSCRSSALVLESSGCSSVLKSSGSSSSGGESTFASGAITRNIVAKGKYPVALKNYGPTPDQQIPVTTSQVTVPVQEKPTVRLPSSIPAPKIISHSCTCYKTILRPRVQQQIINVPSIHRYVETTHSPIIENIQFEAIPVNCEGAESSSGSGRYQFVQVGSGSSCGCQGKLEFPRFQSVEPPSIRIVEAPRYQTVEIPRIQVVEAPVFKTVELPQFSLGSSCSPCQN